MAGEDRGGLNYRIDVKDGFSKSLKRFRKEVRGAKKDFESFQRAKSRKSGPRSDAQLIEKELKAQQKSLAANIKAQKQREQTAVRLRNAAAADRKREEASVNRSAKTRERAERARQIAIAKSRRELDKAAKAAARLDRNLKKSAFSAGDLAFKFRRLVGTLAIFTLARRAVQGFNAMIAAGLRFNDTVEASTLGIAGLLTALGDVTDEFGNTLEPAEQLGAAVGIAREQIQLLRADSLRTVATFEQLLDTFQVAVGPGLAAGLGLDEIRTLSVQISQAATALSVPQNQLAEEIRSLLAGTIQARTTRIATALGITNEDIREMKAAGVLFEELTKGLEGFSAAAEAAAKRTLSGISTLLGGAFAETLGSASEELRNTLLQDLNDLFDLLVQINEETGKVELNPEFVASVKPIFDALADGVKTFREFSEAGSLDLLGSTFSAAAVAVELMVGAFRGVARVLVPIAALMRKVSDFVGLTAKDFAAAADGASATLTAIIAIQVALAAVGKLNPLAAAFTVVVLALDQILEKVTGVKTSLRETAQLIALGMGKAFVSVSTTVSSVATNIAQAFKRAIDEIISTTKIAALKAQAFLIEESFLGDPAKAQRLRDEAFQLEKDANDRAAAIKAGAEVEIAAIEERGRLRQEALNREIAKILNEADPNTTPGGEGEAPSGGASGKFTARSKGSVEIEKRIILLRQEQPLIRARAAAAEIAQRAEAQALGSIQTALAAARTSVAIAQAELTVKRQQAKAELDLIAAKARSTTGAEQAQQEDLFRVVADRRQAELEILATQVKQSQELERQAELVANGDVFDGFQRGLIDMANEFGTRFTAGIEIARAAVDGLAQFTSRAIVDAFDPTKEVDIVERFARLMQQIAQVIIQQLIQLAIARAVLGAPAGPVAPAPGLGIPIGVFGAGFAKGGLIPDHLGPKAQGLATGGRPAHIPQSDTIPAWLTPGEFVMQKGAVDNIGISTLTAMNSGNFGVTGSADAAGASTGMARGGSVAESARPSGASSGTPAVLPAVVAGEKQMDQLTNGGKRAMLEFMREHSDTISGFQRG